MNTASKVLLVALLFAAPAFAQNVRVDNVTFSSVQGFPFLPGATITICTAVGSGLPCSPTVSGTCLSISDVTCNQSATLTSDALGNYGFWIQPGSYTYTVTKAGFGGFGPKALTLACTPVASCTVTGAVTVNSPGSITAGVGVPTSLTNLTVSGTLSPANMSNEIWMDNVAGADWCARFTTAMGQLPSTGGNIITRAQGLQTCATAPTVNKPNLMLKMAKGIKVPLGTNSFLVPSGTGQYGFGMMCEGAMQNAGTSTPLGCVFSYTGTGIAIKIGDTAARIYQPDIEGVSVDISGAGSAAIGIEMIRVFNAYLSKNQVNCSGSASTQQGIVIDGSTEFSDLIELNNNRVLSCGGFQVHAINSGGGTVNALGFSGGASEYNCGNVASAVGVKLDAGGGTTAFSPQVDIENCSIALEIASNNNLNMLAGRLEGNTLCVQYDSGAAFNSIFTENQNCTVTDNSGTTSNSFNAWFGRAQGTGSTSGLFPANLTKLGFSIAGDTNVILGSATSWNAGVIGLTKAQNDVSGARAFGGLFRSSFSNNGTSAVSILSEGLSGTDCLHIGLFTAGTDAPDLQPKFKITCAGVASPAVAGGVDLGTTLLPFGNLWLGTAATNNFKFQPAVLGGARIISIPDPSSNANLTLTPGTTSQKAETGSADTNVLTVTPVAAIGTYRACVVISVSSATAGVISWTLRWTDSNGNVQADIAQDLFQQGTAAPALTFTTSAAGNYNGCTTFDVNNASGPIIVKWVGGGTTAAKMSATVERLI